MRDLAQSLLSAISIDRLGFTIPERHPTLRRFAHDHRVVREIQQLGAEQTFGLVILSVTPGPVAILRALAPVTGRSSAVTSGRGALPDDPVTLTGRALAGVDHAVLPPGDPVALIGSAVTIPPRNRALLGSPVTLLGSPVTLVSVAIALLGSAVTPLSDAVAARSRLPSAPINHDRTPPNTQTEIDTHARQDALATGAGLAVGDRTVRRAGAYRGVHVRLRNPAPGRVGSLIEGCTCANYCALPGIREPNRERVELGSANPRV